MEQSNKVIVESIRESVRLKESLLSDNEGINFVSSVAEEIVESYSKGGKVLICGNGGSAADSQHFAAELVGRFILDRKPLPAIALTTDSSILTAVANDYSYDEVFVRQADALANLGDVFIGISTSGNSTNVIKALQIAKEKGCITCCLLGKDGGALKEMAQYCYVVPSGESARIQEVHIMIEHIICEIVEQKIFG